MAQRARCTWRSYRDIHDIFHGIGFGTGKDGIGLFDIQVKADETLLMEFVPFDPVDEMGHLLPETGGCRRHQTSRPIAARPATRAGGHERRVLGQGHPAVLQGSGRGLYFGALALIVMDFTNRGVGEDHFVSGIRYRGQSLKNEVIREVDREMYPVSWYSHEKSKWLPMYDHN